MKLVDVSEGVFDAKLTWMDNDAKGPWMKSNDDAHLIKRKSIRDFYSSEKESEYSKYTKNLLLKDDNELEDIRQQLKRYNRKPRSVKLDCYSLFSSFIDQVRFKETDKYDEESLRRQIAYDGAKFSDFLKTVIHKDEDESESYESFLRNLFHGYSHPCFKSLEIAALVWNISIDVVIPRQKTVHIHHSGKKADIVLIHNGLQGYKSHFSSTGKFELI